MKMQEFMQKMLEAFPNAEVGEDNDRQLVIYTNLQVDPVVEAEVEAAAGGDPETYAELMNMVPLIDMED